VDAETKKGDSPRPGLIARGIGVVLADKKGIKVYEREEGDASNDR